MVWSVCLYTKFVHVVVLVLLYNGRPSHTVYIELSLLKLSSIYKAKLEVFEFNALIN